MSASVGVIGSIYMKWNTRARPQSRGIIPSKNTYILHSKEQGTEAPGKRSFRTSLSRRTHPPMKSERETHARQICTLTMVFEPTQSKSSAVGHYYKTDLYPDDGV